MGSMLRNFFGKGPSDLWQDNKARNVPRDQRLVYDGIMSLDEIKWCLDLMNDYPFCIEMSKFPHHQWIEENFKKRKWLQANDFFGARDEYVERESTLYGTVARHRDDIPLRESGGFFFVKDQDDYNAVINGLPRLVINTRPFRTLLIY